MARSRLIDAHSSAWLCAIAVVAMASAVINTAAKVEIFFIGSLHGSRRRGALQLKVFLLSILAHIGYFVNTAQWFNSLESQTTAQQSAKKVGGDAARKLEPPTSMGIRGR